MLNISEIGKLEYLEKWNSQSVSLSEDILMFLCENSDECIRSELAQTLSLYHNKLSEEILVLGWLTRGRCLLGIDLCFLCYITCTIRNCISVCNLKKFLVNSRLNINVISKFCVIQVFTFPFVKCLDHISILAHILCIISEWCSIIKLDTPTSKE